MYSNCQKLSFHHHGAEINVIDKIFEASQNIVKKSLSGTRHKIIGVTNEGMNILMVIDEHKALITAYPVVL